MSPDEQDDAGAGAHPLPDAQLDQLEALLAQEPDSLPLDALQGFVCAVLSAPQVIEADRWMAAAMGRESVAEDHPARELMLAFHAATAAELLSEDGLGLLLYPVAEGSEEMDYETWCAGYMDGVDLWEPAWDEAAGDDEDEVGEMLLPFLALSGAFESDPRLREDLGLEADEEERLIEGWRDNLAVHVLDMHDWWLDARHTPATWKRDDPKVGRNDPCPCGSGRKYKFCHGA